MHLYRYDTNIHMQLKHSALEQEQNQIGTHEKSKLATGENGQSQSLLVNIQTWMFTKVFGMFMLVSSLRAVFGTEKRLIHFEVILSTRNVGPNSANIPQAPKVALSFILVDILNGFSTSRDS